VRLRLLRRYIEIGWPRDVRAPRNISPRQQCQYAESWRHLVDAYAQPQVLNGHATVLYLLLPLFIYEISAPIQIEARVYFHAQRPRRMPRRSEMRPSFYTK
jgi:hypothetical protein